MGAYLRRLVRESAWVIIPALLYFATGVTAVWRQNAGFRLDRSTQALTKEVEALEALSRNLEARVDQLTSRDRLEAWGKQHGLRQPSGPEVVLLQYKGVRPRR